MFIRGNIRTNKETGSALDFGGPGERPLRLPIHQRIADAQCEIEFGRRQNVSANRTRRGTINPGDLSLQDRVGLVIADNSISAILLKLLDHGIRDEDRDPGDQSFVFERRDRNLVHCPQVVGLDRPDVITGAAA